jgi:DNA polymerase-1
MTAAAETPMNGAARSNGAHDGSGAPPLREAHRKVLTERAIPLEVALVAGLRSVTDLEAVQLLGIPYGGLAIPYLNTSPAYWRIRLDGGPTRYMCPKGREVPVYVPPSVVDAPVIEGELGDALVVVEAPLKALALRAMGLYAVGLGGTGTTLTKTHDRLNASWDALDLEDRVVIVLFDANRRNNPSVARDEARLVVALQHDGGARVRIADLPRGPRGREAWGPDDFLKERGPDALLKVLSDAVHGDPLHRIAALVEANDVGRAEELLSDTPFLLSLIERGPHATAAARRKLRELKIRAGDLDAALKKYARSLRGDDEPEEAESDAPYSTDDGHFVFLETKHPFPVCNFTAQIVEDVTVDDGAEQSREFTIEGETDTGVKLPRVIVPAREFASSSAIWVTAGWGSKAIVKANCMQHIHPAIQFFSPETKRSTVFQHTGWRNVDGHLVYLSASGAVGATVDVNVRLDATLTRYALPTESSDVEETRKAVRASLRILDAAPNRVTIPALASVYRAPLCEWLYCDAVVWMFGTTGSLKSSLTALLVGHYGTGFDRERLTASWQDTATSIESKLFRAKDTLVPVDDFAPSGVEDRDELRRKAAQVIRGVGNGQSRSRMKSDLTARADRPPRALVLGTGEDMPTGESIVARTFPIGMRREDVRLDVLSECQRDAHLLPVAMRAYLEQIVSWVAVSEDFAGYLRRRFEELRTTFSAGGHLRAPAAAAHLGIGWRAFLKFARGVGAIDDAQHEDLVRRGDEALKAQLEAQATASADEDAVRQFLKWLRVLIASGRIYLEDQDVAIVQMPGRDTVGWRLSDGRIHLLPDVAYTAVHRAMREGGRALRVKDTTLWTRLEELGHATAYEKGRQTVKRTHAGQRHRVVELVAGALEDGDGPEDGGPGGGTGAPPQANGISGAPQHAVTPEGNGKRPDRPAPAGGIAGPPEHPGEKIEGPSFSPTSPGDAFTPRRSGAIGAEEEERREKSLRHCRLAPAASLRLSWGTSGTIGAQSGREALVMDAARLPELARDVEAAGVVGLDLETTGLSPIVDRPRLLQLALPDGVVHVVDLFATGGPGPLSEALSSVDVVGHNLAFDFGFLRRHFGICPRAWDTMLASQLIDGGANLHAKGFHKIDGVVERLLGVKLDKSLQTSDWSSELSDDQIAYAARDVEHLFPLRAELEKQLRQRRLETAMQIERDVLPVVVGMRLAGVPVDVAALDALATEMGASSAAASERLRAALGGINPRSADKQLLPALRAVGLNVLKTNAEALAPYRDHPLVRDVMTMRTDKKTADDARTLAELARACPDGRVRPDWHQLGAPTGRMSSSAPNMQGLPKTRAMRACIAASPGRRFIVADYAAIELRVLARVVRDKRLLRIFAAGGDPHRELASILLKKAPAKVTSDERKRIKPVNFGFAFGMGPARFVSYALKDYGVAFTEDEARRFRAAYLGAYREVDAWQQQTRALMDLEARTLAGRVRDFASRTDGYTDRLNLPIQGTAADGMKRAMARLAPRLAKLDSQIVLAVHDELVVEAPEQTALEVEAAVRAGMIEGMAVDVSDVPIVVEAEVRRTWGKP